MTVKLVWATPQGDELLVRIARVSNPAKAGDMTTAPRLLSYLARHKHWSPFEMVCACLEVVCSRAIGRQILRHKLAVQEFSQRYAPTMLLDPGQRPEPRLASTSGSRQAGRPAATPDEMELVEVWRRMRDQCAEMSEACYRRALDIGIAPESARDILPEGLTSTRMYVTGSVRNWWHYTQLRVAPTSQEEHREIARQVRDRLCGAFPMTMRALLDAEAAEERP